MVDIAVFKAQCVIIADAMNIMYPDRETRSPLHPLRQLSNLFITGSKGQSFISNLEYIDQAYAGRYPSGSVEPSSTVLTAPLVLPTGVILKATGTTFDPAYLELTGDFVAGTTVDVVMEVDSQPGTGATFTTTVNLSASGAADRWSRLIRGATDITSTSKGSKVFIVPGGAATTITISALTIT